MHRPGAERTAPHTNCFATCKRPAQMKNLPSLLLLAPLVGPAGPILRRCHTFTMAAWCRAEEAQQWYPDGVTFQPQVRQSALCNMAARV